MIQNNCSKCGAELIMHEGYGVCSKCGEIVGFDIEEEVLEEITAEEMQEDAVIEEAAEDEISSEDDAFEEIAEEKTEQDIPEMLEFTGAPKRSKAPLIILIVVILCVLAVLGGFFISKMTSDIVESDIEQTSPVSDEIKESPEEKIAEEEPEVAVEEEPTEKDEQRKETEKPAPAPVEKKPIKKEEAIITPTPSISYRIRKTADDSSTQIGAFSDLERAKAFAESHSADGYKVYDMYGNIVFEP